MTDKWYQRIVFVAVAAGCLALCTCDAPRGGMDRLESRDPGQRIASIVDLTNRATQTSLASMDRSQAADLIPRLVDRLEDEDEGVRFYAILGLEKLTGTRLGYRYGDSADQRRTAVNRWRAFVAGAAEQGAPTSVRAEETDSPDAQGDGPL